MLVGLGLRGIKTYFGQRSLVCELNRYTSLQKFLIGTRPLRTSKSGLGSADIVWFQSRHRAANHNKCRKVDIVSRR